MKCNEISLAKFYGSFRRKAAWVKKVSVLLKPAIKMGKFFSVTEETLNSPGSTIVIDYIGKDGEPLDQLYTLENLLNIRFNGGIATLKKGKASYTIKLANDFVEFIAECNKEHYANTEMDEPDDIECVVHPIQSHPVASA